jgi:hypothetical protein
MSTSLSGKSNSEGKAVVVIPIVLLIVSNVDTFFKISTNAALEILDAGSRGCCFS